MSSITIRQLATIVAWKLGKHQRNVLTTMSDRAGHWPTRKVYGSDSQHRILFHGLADQKLVHLTSGTGAVLTPAGRAVAAAILREQR